MSNIAETRVKISLTDAMSQGLIGAKKNIDSLGTSAHSAKSAFSGLSMQTAGVAAGLTGLYGIADAMSTMIKLPYQFAKSMETNELGIAGILQSMTDVEDKQLEWNSAVMISKGIISELNIEALKTAATTEELVEAFRALLGPGLAANMSIEQLKEFTTVGVNAVKSLGLPRQQIVQELRDMIQGGIRPQSSTLAVSLGLTDNDIKAAKASSEGLFTFLMKRLEGFNRASRETPKTMMGLVDQIEEGFTRTTALGANELYFAYKQALSKIANLFINQTTFSLNEKTISTIQAFSKHTVNALTDMADIGQVAGTIVLPAIETIGTGLGIVADNTKMIAIGFGSWKLYQTYNDIMMVTSATMGTYQAQTILGSAVQKVNNIYSAGHNAMNSRYTQEMQLANQTANTMQQAHNRMVMEAKERQLIESTVNKLNTDGYKGLAIRINALSDRYKLLGATAEQAGKMQYEAAKLASNGHRELAVNVIQTQEAHMLAANSAKKQANSLSSVYSKGLKATSALGFLSGSMLMLTEDTNSFVYSLAEGVFKLSIMAQAVLMLIPYLDKLKASFAGVAIVKALALGGPIVAIGAGIGAATAGAYAFANNLSLDDVIARYTYNPNNGQEETTASAQIAQKRRLQDIAEANATHTRENLKLKFPKDLDLETQRGKTSAERLAEKAAKEQQKALSKLTELSKELDQKIMEQTGNSLDVAGAKLEAELQKMQTIIDKAKINNIAEVDIANVLNKQEEYRKLKNAQDKRDYLTEELTMTMDYYQAMEDSRLNYTSNINASRVQDLEQYKEQLSKELASTDITQKEKLRLMQEYANAVKEINNATGTNLGESIKSALFDIKNTQFDLHETMITGWSDITGSITGAFDNMYTDQKSFTERMRNLYSDLTNNILNMMFKIIMQGLIMNTITAAFGLGGSTIGNLTGNINDSSKLLGQPILARARGGIAQGLTLVGEQGPELAYFGQPGMVYSADKTKEMLSNRSSYTPNISINIKNESGVPVQTGATSASINGKSCIINMVMQSLQNNENGSRDSLKALVNTY